MPPQTLRTLIRHSFSRRTAVSLVIALAVVFARSAGAQPSPSAAPWDEVRVVARALERTPAVQVARARLDAAHAQEAFGHTPVVGNPVVSMRAMFGVPDESAATYSLLVGFPFDVSGRRGHALREAARAVEEAEAGLAVAVNEARAEARTAWSDVSLANAALQTANARTDTARELLNRVRIRERAQVATALDITLAERELAEAEAEVAAARRLREESLARFREALDLPALAEVSVSPLRAPELPAGLTREECVARAVRNRREASAFAAAAARLRVSADRLRAGAVAPLTLNGELEVQGNQARATTVGVSASWALPVLATAQGERAVALAEAVATDTRRTLAERRAGREASAAWALLAAQLEQFAALDRRVVPAAERAIALTEVLFEASAVDAYRVLLARRDVYAARAQRLGVAREAWRARIALDRATGTGEVR